MKIFRYPVDEKYPITLEYGYEYSKETCEKFGWKPGKKHAGVDFGTPEWTQIFSPHAGIVKRTSDKSTGWGLRVSFDYMEENGIPVKEGLLNSGT